MWTRLDDGFTEHPKIAQVGPLGMALQVAGLVYSNRNLTDGFIPYGVARQLMPMKHEDNTGKVYHVAVACGHQGWDPDEALELVIAWLVEANVWEQVPGGYLIHDFDDYNLTKEEVIARREARSESGRKGGLAKARANAKQGAKQTPEQTSSNGSSKPSSKTEANSYPVPAPVPVPSPEPDSLGTTSTATAPDGAWESQGFDPSTVYFIGRLKQADEGWDSLTPLMLRKLIRRHGEGVVTTALGYLREAPGSEPVRNPIALIEAMCQHVEVTA